MHLLETIVAGLSRILDSLAGIILAATALLIVANIFGRTVLQSSILGTYEMVGFLTAAVVGLALARCALENGHIAVGLFVERLPAGPQRVVELAAGFPIFVFLCFISYNLFVYGAIIAATGEVAPTTQMIYHPFVYLVALGFLVLALTLLLKLLRLFFGGEHR